ncbi:MAG: putative transposase of family [Herminiimonas sp.]|nr:putative transposase of family [Herminiimonas sp.]
MQWIEGIVREDARLVATAAIDGNGKRHTYSLSELSKLSKAHSRSHISKLNTDFQNWQLSSANDYISGFGLSSTVDEAHRVFKFEHEKVTYLVPAAVLFKAIFRPLNLTATYLFRPQGLEQACVPTLSSAGANFVMSGLSKRAQSCSSLQQPLSWLWCFPSAKLMWNSVYSYACNGLLACDLPVGNARIVAKGVKKDAQLFVTEITMLQITTDEEPFEFACVHSKTIVFHEGVSFRNRQLSDFVARADNTLIQVNGKWDVTDQEWDAIYQLFSEQEKRGSSKRKHELRTLIDGILAKLGTGIPWTKFEFKAGTWSNASKLYGECRKDGRWLEIQTILKHSRRI